MDVSETADLLGENFSLPETAQENVKPEDDKPSSALLDLNWSSNSEFLGGDFMPSKLLQQGTFDFSDLNVVSENEKSGGKTEAPANGSHVSWLSLFAELDPLANPTSENNSAGDRA